jgi:hypothetical protein
MKSILEGTLTDINHGAEEIRMDIQKGDIERAYRAAERLKIKADDVLHFILKLSDFD